MTTVQTAMDDDTPNTQAEPVRACVLIEAPVKSRLRNYHAKTRLYAQVLAMDFYELPRHRTCVFDNPDTFRRECWQDGKLLAFITSALMATKGFNGNPQLFFGLNVGPWKTGQLLGMPMP